MEMAPSHGHETTTKSRQRVHMTLVKKKVHLAGLTASCVSASEDAHGRTCTGIEM
jgi:hypothetical protein